MDNNNISIWDLINSLPRNYQIRFNSLGRYVRGLIEEEESEREQNLGLDNEDISFIQLAVFVFSLDDFLRAGTRAAQQASQTLEGYKIPGFQIGSTIFTKNNESTMRGEVLANQLRDVVADLPIGELIQNSSSIRNLVSRIIQYLNDE
jgi:hypothetical protein